MIQLIELTKIILDPRIQGRVQVDMALVAEYQEHYQDLPPIDLYSEETPLGLRYWPGDGWHRYLAHQAAGAEVINARVHKGGFEAALLHAVRANTSKTHGLKRSQADKQRAIEIYLTNSDWYRHSDPRVAKACEVSHPTVATRRAELEAAGTIPKTDERIGFDGKAQTTKKQVVNLQPEKSEAQPPILPPEEKQPSLLIDSPVQSSTKVFSTFDQAVAQQEVRKEKIVSGEEKGEASSITFLDYNSGSPAKTKTSPVEFTKTEEHPLFVQLPQPTAGVESSTPAKKPKLAKVKCPGCKGGKPTKTLCKLCWAKGYLELEVIPSEGAENGSYQGYCSPPLLIELTRLIGPIGADFCHNPHSKWEARLMIDESQDSLSDLWPWASLLRDDEIAPLNPPWGNMPPFVDKLCIEVTYGKQWLLIGPGGSTAAVWYQKAARSAALRIDPDKRLSYYKEGVEETSPRDPTVLFYWGHQAEKVAAIFARQGWLVTKRVEPEEYAQAAELLRKKEFDARQQALPLEATPPSEATTPQEEAGEPWLSRALSQLKACTTREEIDAVYVRLATLTQNHDEISALMSCRTELRAKLPHQDNVKPEHLSKKEEPTPEPTLYHLEAWLKEGAVCERKGGYALFHNEVREVTLTAKQLANWQKDERLKLRTEDWLEEGFKEIALSTALGEALKVFDRLVEQSVTGDERAELKKRWATWRRETPTAPTPKRNKGRNEEPIKKKTSKKAGRR